MNIIEKIENLKVRAEKIRSADNKGFGDIGLWRLEAEIEELEIKKIEALWDGWIDTMKINGKKPVNLLGSVEEHKKSFLKFANNAKSISNTSI